MKTILALFLLLSSLSAFGAVFTQRVDMSSTNITIHFNGTNSHLATINVPFAIDAVMLDNRSASEVVINCSVTGATIPSDTSAQNFYVNASETWVTPDKAGFGTQCYLRSFSGTLSSGIVVVTAVGH